MPITNNFNYSKNKERKFSIDECTHQPYSLSNLAKLTSDGGLFQRPASIRETQLIMNTREIINNERSTFRTFDTPDVRPAIHTSAFPIFSIRHFRHFRFATLDIRSHDSHFANLNRFWFDVFTHRRILINTR